MSLETKTKSLDSVYEAIEAVSPDCKEYLSLYIDMINEIETPFYRENPDQISHCFPKGLDDDINEIISYFKHFDDPDLVINILKDLHDVLRKTHPVTFNTLKPLFQYFQIEEFDVYESEEKLMRFRMPNLLFTRKDLEDFYVVCGLVQIKDEGAGSHTKWVDEYENFLALSSSSSKAWIKNNIKGMIYNGFPIERIKQACDKLDISFEIL
ncbi:hypothetical protein COU74_01035 [Candidatus Peregrinibacteria bacterium CG10_big_fil_rev_8_21_14_0_10_36_19]|nr:MAG: hypothetical protein COU74_01035 [Candidatus Peregrinibacteria bacterium CG10_big_fil_rev_8_21_14_0_10_36_19]